MPDDVAMDKVLVLEKLGAKVERVRPGKPHTIVPSVMLNRSASIIDEKQVSLNCMSSSCSLTRFFVFISSSYVTLSISSHQR